MSNLSLVRILFHLEGQGDFPTDPRMRVGTDRHYVSKENIDSAVRYPGMLTVDDSDDLWILRGGILDNNYKRILSEDGGTFNGPVTFNDDVIIQGDTIQVDSEVTATDAVIEMNAGELGIGVTLGYSGVHINRGAAPEDFWMGFDEVRDAFSVGSISELSAAQIATTQLVATREDSPGDGYIMTWNASTLRLEGIPAGNAAVTPSLQQVTNVGATTTNLIQLADGFAVAPTSGKGIELYFSTRGVIQAYDRDGAAFQDLDINASLLTVNADTTIDGTTTINTLNNLALSVASLSNGDIHLGSGTGTSNEGQPTLTGKTSTQDRSGLYFIAGANNTNSFADMVFDVREDNNSDFSNLTSRAFRWTRIGTELMSLTRNGVLTVSNNTTINGFLTTNVASGQNQINQQVAGTDEWGMIATATEWGLYNWTTTSYPLFVTGASITHNLDTLVNGRLTLDEGTQSWVQDGNTGQMLVGYDGASFYVAAGNGATTNPTIIASSTSTMTTLRGAAITLDSSTTVNGNILSGLQGTGTSIERRLKIGDPSWNLNTGSGLVFVHRESDGYAELQITNPTNGAAINVRNGSGSQFLITSDGAVTANGDATINGNLTLNPSANVNTIVLDNSANNNVIRFDTDAGLDSRLDFYEDGTAKAYIGYDSSAGGLKLNGDGLFSSSANLIIDSSGHTTINGKLTVNDGTQNQGILIQSTDAGAYIGFEDDTTSVTMNWGVAGNNIRGIINGVRVVDWSETSLVMEKDTTINGNVSAQTYRSSRVDGDIYIQAISDTDFISLGSQTTQNVLQVSASSGVVANANVNIDSSELRFVAASNVTRSLIWERSGADRASVYVNSSNQFQVDSGLGIILNDQTTINSGTGNKVLLLESTDSRAYIDISDSNTTVPMEFGINTNTFEWRRDSVDILELDDYSLKSSNRGFNQTQYYATNQAFDVSERRKGFYSGGTTSANAGMYFINQNLGGSSSYRGIRFFATGWSGSAITTYDIVEITGNSDIPKFKVLEKAEFEDTLNVTAFRGFAIGDLSNVARITHETSGEFRVLGSGNSYAPVAGGAATLDQHFVTKAQLDASTPTLTLQDVTDNGDTTTQNITAAIVTATNNNIIVSGTSPLVGFTNTGETANARVRFSGTNLRLQVASDGSTYSDRITVGASSNNISGVTYFDNTIETHGGNNFVDTSGSESGFVFQNNGTNYNQFARIGGASGYLGIYSHALGIWHTQWNDNGNVYHRSVHQFYDSSSNAKGILTHNASNWFVRAQAGLNLHLGSNGVNSGIIIDTSNNTTVQGYLTSNGHTVTGTQTINAGTANQALVINSTDHQVFLELNDDDTQVRLISNDQVFRVDVDSNTRFTLGSSFDLGVGGTIGGNVSLGGNLTLDGNDRKIFWDGDQVDNNTFNLMMDSRVTSSGSRMYMGQVANRWIISQGASANEVWNSVGTITFVPNAGGSGIYVDGERIVQSGGGNSGYVPRWNDDGVTLANSSISTSGNDVTVGGNLTVNGSSISRIFLNQNGINVGSVYANSINQFGFLDKDGQWSYRHTSDSAHEWLSNNSLILTLAASGDLTTTGVLTVDSGSAEQVVLKSLDNSGNNYIRFEHSNGTNQGYIGYGSSGNDYMYIRNELSGNLTLSAQAGDVHYEAVTHYFDNEGGTNRGYWDGSNLRITTGLQSYGYSDFQRSANDHLARFQMSRTNGGYVSFYNAYNSENAYIGYIGTGSTLLTGGTRTDFVVRAQTKGHLNIGSTVMFSWNLTESRFHNRASFVASTWQVSDDGNQRLYFANGGETYVKAVSNIVFRTANDNVDKLYINTDGKLVHTYQGGTSWGTSQTGSYHTELQDNTSATWILTANQEAASDNWYGMQVLNLNNSATMRLYSGSNYLQINDTGIRYNTTYMLTGTTSVEPTANTIPIRDGSGYLHSSWINMEDNTGLYYEGGSEYLYTSAGTWRIRGGSETPTYTYLGFETNDGVDRGGVYANSSGEIGFVEGGASTWIIQIKPDDAVLFRDIDYLRWTNGSTNRSAFGLYDAWLRLNPTSEYTNGTYTPSLIRADGGFTVGSGVVHNLESNGEYNATGQIRAKGWHQTGTGAAAEMGVSSGDAYFMGFNRTSASYINAYLTGSNAYVVSQGSGNVYLNTNLRISSSASTIELTGSDADSKFLLYRNYSGSSVGFVLRNNAGSNIITANGNTGQLTVDRSKTGSSSSNPRGGGYAAAHVLQSTHWYGDTNSETMYLGEASNTVNVRGDLYMDGSAYLQANGNYLDVQAASSGSHGISISNHAGTIYGYVYSDNAGGFGLLHGGSWALRMTSPSVAIFTGTVTATNFIDSSDSRLKTELAHPVNGMDLVRQLEPKRYIKNGKEETGFFADQLPKEAEYMREQMAGGLWGMKYSQMIAVHTMALQEVDERLNRHEAMLSKHKEQHTLSDRRYTDLQNRVDFMDTKIAELLAELEILRNKDSNS